MPTIVELLEENTALRMRLEDLEKDRAVHLNRLDANTIALKKCGDIILEQEVHVGNLDAEIEELDYSLRQQIAKRDARIVALRDALKQISRRGCGLQGLIEDGASDEKIAEYWANNVHYRIQLAYKALEEDGN